VAGRGKKPQRLFPKVQFHQRQLNRRFTELGLFLTCGQIDIAFHQQYDIFRPSPVS